MLEKKMPYNENDGNIYGFNVERMIFIIAGSFLFVLQRCYVKIEILLSKKK